MRILTKILTTYDKVLDNILNWLTGEKKWNSY